MSRMNEKKINNHAGSPLFEEKHVSLQFKSIGKV
jgi:hypothetical protein